MAEHPSSQAIYGLLQILKNTPGKDQELALRLPESPCGIICFVQGAITDAMTAWSTNPAYGEQIADASLGSPDA